MFYDSYFFLRLMFKNSLIKTDKCIINIKFIIIRHIEKWTKSSKKTF